MVLKEIHQQIEVHDVRICYFGIKIKNGLIKKIRGKDPAQRNKAHRIESKRRIS
jgi:hypothetical protein